MKERRQKEGRNTGGKTAVLGMLERSKTIRGVVIEERTKKTMQGRIREHVARGTDLMADEFLYQWAMPNEYYHNVVNHLETYVDGNVQCNGVENFWSLLKRTIGGTYVSVEPYHLFRYVDEQAFRFNDDGGRFSYLVRKIVGKRLTYAELTGKEGETAEAFYCALAARPQQGVLIRWRRYQKNNSSLCHHLSPGRYVETLWRRSG